MNIPTMSWPRLISNKRLGLEQYHDNRRHSRSDFQRDFDRMVFSSPFRRLQNKTQVFPLPGSIFVHNRLTHSLEVSSVGRSMAGVIAHGLRETYKGEPWIDSFFHIPDIVATACLCHDLGNPPFGHSGEKAIGSFFSEPSGNDLRGDLTEAQWADITHFEGNANSFRLLAHQFNGRRPGGFAMTYSSLASLVKYPYASTYAGEKGKFGFFCSELDIYRRVADELGIPALNEERTRFMRHPLVFIVEAADDICYQIMDIEDAHKLKILPHDFTVELLLEFIDPGERPHTRHTLDSVSDPNEQVAYLRSKVIGILTEECARAFLRCEWQILSGVQHAPLIESMDNEVAMQAYHHCTKVAYSKIYSAPEVVDIELAGHRIITYLLERLLHAVLHPEEYASRLLLLKVPEQYEVSASSRYSRIQSVLDHISAMTDVYALDLFRKLNGHSLPAV